MIVFNVVAGIIHNPKVGGYAALMVYNVKNVAHHGNALHQFDVIHREYFVQSTYIYITNYVRDFNFEIGYKHHSLISFNQASYTHYFTPILITLRN